MSVIYEPKGAAREYAPLACNLYRGCVHGCRYCYVPTIPPWRGFELGRETFHGMCEERSGVLPRFYKEAKKLSGDRRPILFCFTCDPYPPERVTAGHERPLLIREVLEICAVNDLKAMVLTKGGRRAIRDFDVMRRGGVAFGSSVGLVSDAAVRKWEPGAETYGSRRAAIVEAWRCGIRTWCSLEPVVNAQEALYAIQDLLPYVDEWKVGKLNHGAQCSEELGEIERSIDWRAFRVAAERLLAGKQYVIKADLERASRGDGRPLRMGVSQ